MQTKLKRNLLAPLVYSAAIVLLFEEWLWDAATRGMRRIASQPAIKRLETRIGKLSPYAALAVFVLPALLLFPIKLLALYAIAQGHAGLGITLILAAKLSGTALAARLYGLTKSSLLSLAWLAAGHDSFIGFKDRMITRLRSTDVWRKVEALARITGIRRRLLWLKFRQNHSGNGRLRRLMRKLVAQMRARRRS